MNQPPAEPDNEPPADSGTDPQAGAPAEPSAASAAESNAAPPGEPSAEPPAESSTGPPADSGVRARAESDTGVLPPGYDPRAENYPPMPPPPPEAGYGYDQPSGAGGTFGQPGAVVAAPGMYFDQVSGLALPQGVELAAVGRRIGAFFLAFPLFIVTLGIGYIAWGLIVWTDGQTPALQVLGMRCWRPETSSVPGFWWMALREIIGRWVEGLLGIITLGFSFILMLTRRDRQCLHDLIAGTVVLRDPDKILAPPAA
jgi:uncharacterized RDD family membrane protein YckC